MHPGGALPSAERVSAPILEAYTEEMQAPAIDFPQQSAINGYRFPPVYRLDEMTADDTALLALYYLRDQRTRRAVETELEELRAQFATLTPLHSETVIQLAETREALVRANLSAPAARPESTSSGRLRPQKPPVFNGSRESADSFFDLAANYIFLLANDFPTEQSMIRWTLGLFQEGTAVDYGLRVLREIGKGEAAASWTWREFKKDFDINFSDPDRKGAAQEKLERIQTGRRTVGEYTTEFRQLASRTEYGEEALIMRYKKGLPQDIHRDLATCENPPATLDAWYSRAQLLARQRESLPARFTGYNNSLSTTSGSAPTQRSRFIEYHTNPSRSTQPLISQSASPAAATPTVTTTITPSTSSVVPMEIDRGRVQRPIGPNKVCFICGSPDHLRFQCPQKGTTAFSIRAALLNLEDAVHGALTIVESDEESEQPTEQQAEEE